MVQSHDELEGVADLDLPDMGDVEDDGDGVAGEALEELATPPDDDEDPFDDAVAADIPLDIAIATDQVEPSVIGDDALGVDGDVGAEGIVIEEDGGSSLIDSGDDDEDLHDDGDQHLGIDPIPREIDDGGVEGLDDADAERIETSEFPPLDGADDDDDVDELDVGIDLTQFRRGDLDD